MYDSCLCPERRMLTTDGSVRRSGDRACGQVHKAARHLPLRCQGLTARGSALRAEAHSEVDRQFSLGHNKEAQGEVANTAIIIPTPMPSRCRPFSQPHTLICWTRTSVEQVSVAELTDKLDMLGKYEAPPSQACNFPFFLF